MAKPAAGKGSTKTKSSSSKDSGDTTTWAEFRSRRTAELKEEEPGMSGAERQKAIQAEWKDSDENPKAVRAED
ncbi:hypothetical protein JCM1840_000482 [Sporobolomyces johnsonii]